MEFPLVIELLDRRGRFKERHRIASLPATIGRSYGCDVIVDDPFVSPEHLRLSEGVDGEVVAEDLHSTNGTWTMHGRQPLPRARIVPDLCLRIGETTLRFRHAAHPIVPTLPMPTRSQLFGLPTGVLAFAVWLALAGVAVGAEYLKTYDEMRVEALIAQFTSVTVAVLLWSGIWAISNRIVTHRFHYLDHCLNAAFWGLLMIVQQQAAGFVAFAFGIDSGMEIAGWICEAAIFSGLLYGHLRLCSSLSRGRLLTAAAGVAAMLTLLSGLARLATYIEEPRWDYALRFRHELKPPVFKLVGSHNLESFFASDRELKAKVDKLADDKR